MRVTIVPSDFIVCIDGVCRGNIDMSTVNPDVHAVQWYDTYGDVETLDPVTRAPINVIIYNLDDYTAVIDQWYALGETPPA